MRQYFEDNLRYFATIFADNKLIQLMHKYSTIALEFDEKSGLYLVGRLKVRVREPSSKHLFYQPVWKDNHLPPLKDIFLYLPLKHMQL
jgi:hypothetical protein